MSDHEHEPEHDDEPLTEAEARAEAERLVRKEVALAQVRQYGDPVLRMRADDVETFDEELARITGRMVELMHDADGVGLAATQIGIVRRFFVCTLADEGCLSLGSIRVPIERAVRIQVAARDETGEPVSLSLEGMDARVVQHELDHLDGVLLLDRTDAEARREALAQLRPRLVLTS